MAWHPSACCRRPNKQGTRSSMSYNLHKKHLLLQTFNMVVEIPRFSQAKFEINRERPLNPIRQDVTSVITGNEQRWIFFRWKRILPKSGFCRTCSRGTDTSATTGLCLKPGRALIIRFWERNEPNKKLNAGPMDGKDWRQGPSWCLWDWHFAKTYWYSCACQVSFVFQSFHFDCLHVCLNVSLKLMIVYSSVCPDVSSF